MGSQLEVRSRGQYQNPVTLVESNLDDDNSKLCLHEPRIPTRFEVTQISTCKDLFYNYRQKNKKREKEIEREKKK